MARLYDQLPEPFYMEYIGCKAAGTGKIHYHKKLEIYYLAEGTCNYFSENVVYPLRAGDVIIIPPGVLHHTDYKGSSRSRFLIYCDGEYIPSSLREALLSSPQIISGQNFHAQLRKRFESLLAEYQGQDPYADDAIRCELGTLLIELIRSKSNQGQRRADCSFVEKAIAFINQHYADPIMLSDVAKHCSVCNEYLSRAFKKYTGFGLNEYLTTLRISHAESMLLQDSDRSISEIAFSCGFQDSNYFSSRFKRIVGISPSQLRKSQGASRNATE